MSERGRLPRWAWVVPVILGLILITLEWGGWGKSNAEESEPPKRRRKPADPAPVPDPDPILRPSIEATPAPVTHEAIDPETGAIIEVVEESPSTELSA